MAARLLQRRFLHTLLRHRSQVPAIKVAEVSCKPRLLCTTPQQNPAAAVIAENLEVKSSLQASGRHDMAMVFTCGVCETRSVKTMSRESYEKGVVVARCGGCDNLHLIADRLGWFGDPSSVEDFLAARGEQIKKGSVDTLSLTLQDLAGTKSGSPI